MTPYIAIVTIRFKDDRRPAVYQVNPMGKFTWTNVEDDAIAGIEYAYLVTP